MFKFIFILIFSFCSIKVFPFKITYKNLLEGTKDDSVIVSVGLTDNQLEPLAKNNISLLVYNQNYNSSSATKHLNQYRKYIFALSIISEIESSIKNYKVNKFANSLNYPCEVLWLPNMLQIIQVLPTTHDENYSFINYKKKSWSQFHYIFFIKSSEHKITFSNGFNIVTYMQV